MCGINIAIGGTMDTVKKMNEATKGRGISESYRSVDVLGGVAWVCYNHLPITTKETVGTFETQTTFVWLNGFISNHKELAKKYNMALETELDTEVLSKCIELGVDLQELNGFFAVVVYYKDYEMFSMFTDRYGIKQLYTYEKDGIEYISSEVKGILAVCPDIELYERAVEDWNYSLGVMNDKTIYKGIKRVRKLDMPIIERSTDTSEKAYKQACLTLIGLLENSVYRNKYDGKDGTFVSGGVDSGLIAKWMKSDYSFSVDYMDANFSEIELIKKNSVGEHFTLLINDLNYIDYSFKVLGVLDDLKAGSCYTNYAIMELASKFVRVVYSGAGGDEFFGGYAHRLDKPINEVIRRNNEMKLQEWSSKYNHYKYDLMFLQAVLIVEDRMSGHFQMETRYPLLDNDIVNFALSLPLEFVKNKRILKDVSGLHEDVVNGKKRGFSNPYFTNKQWAEFNLIYLRNE